MMTQRFLQSKRFHSKFKEETATTMGFLSGYDVKKDKFWCLIARKIHFNFQMSTWTKVGTNALQDIKRNAISARAWTFFIIIIITLFLNTVEHNQQPMWMQLWNIYPKWLVSIFEKKNRCHDINFITLV